MASQDKAMINHENTETRISLLDKKTKLPPKKRFKWSKCKKACLFTVIFAFISIIGAIVFICFADIAKQSRCSISKLVSLSLQECHHQATLETLSNGSSNHVQNQTYVYLQEHHQKKNMTLCANQKNCTSNHTLSAKDLKYVALAEASYETAWEILHDSDDWTLDTGNGPNTGVVYHKYYKDLGKVSKFMGMVAASPAELFSVLVTDEKHFPDWNPIVAKSEILYRVTDNIDISYIATNPLMGGFIAARDYVNLRYWKERNGSMLAIGVAATHKDKPENDDFVRGYNKPGSGVLFRAVEGQPDKCLMEWTLCADFGGWIPQLAVDSAVASSLQDFYTYAKQRVKELQQQPGYKHIDSIPY